MISHHAALIYTMVIAAAVDGDMKDAEFALIGRLTAELPAFAGYDRNKLPETAQECAVILQTDNGLERLVNLIAEALPRHLRETAYLLACETMDVDHQIDSDEMALLDLIRRRLEIDRLAAAAIERATTARFATI